MKHLWIKMSAEDSNRWNVIWHTPGIMDSSVYSSLLIFAAISLVYCAFQQITMIIAHVRLSNHVVSTEYHTILTFSISIPQLRMFRFFMVLYSPRCNVSGRRRLRDTVFRTLPYLPAQSLCPMTNVWKHVFQEQQKNTRNYYIERMSLWCFL